MKKIVSIILILIICVSFVSCEEPIPSNTKTEVTATPTIEASSSKSNDETLIPSTDSSALTMDNNVITFEYPEIIEYGVYTSGDRKSVV